MKSIFAIINAPVKNDESLFPLFPDMICLRRIFVRKRTVFTFVEDAGQKGPGQEGIQTLGLTEVVELQCPVAVVDSDVRAQMPGLFEVDSAGVVLLVLNVPATVYRA